MRVSIVVPTYHEKDNISILFDRVLKVFKENKITGEIIVVDDNSNDGTEQVVEEYKKKKHPVRIFIRKNERGLASACVLGFSHAKGDIIIVMDADLQHPPEKIPELIAAIDKGADIAIGSRFVEGGDVGDFTTYRKMVSKGASLVADLLFKELKDIKDKESGFFAFKKQVIENTNLNPKGYKILLEILVLGKYNSVVEVGFKFGKRKSGESKLGFFTIFTYLSHLLSLMFASGKLNKFIKFCIVGLIGTIVNLGILYGLTTLGLYYLISGAIAIEASVLANFFLNRAWTFKEESIHVTFKNAIFKDHVTRFIGIILNFVCLFVFTEFFNMYYIISMIIGIAVSTLWNFIGNSRWVWKSRP